MEEIWKDIEGYKGLYQVSNLGRIKSLERSVTTKNNSIRTTNTKIITGDEKGLYKRLFLYKNGFRKRHSIHRLVAIAFVPNIENKPFINHIDGNKKNNNYNNLQWCTLKENTQHAYDTGLMIPHYGSNNGNCKLSDDLIKEIRLDYLLNNSRVKDLSIKYNISKAQMSRIVNNKRWKHL